MFDMVTLLTGGGPGSVTEVASITLKRTAFESWATGRASAFAIILFKPGVRPCQHLRQSPQQGETAMSSANTAHSVVAPSDTSKRVAGTIVIVYALITLIPLV